MCMQALQSISMAEERQGEAHADGLPKLSTMQASAALQQALALASTASAVNSVAGYGGFAPAPAPAAPDNGLTALQVRRRMRWSVPEEARWRAACEEGILSLPGIVGSATALRSCVCKNLREVCINP